MNLSKKKYKKFGSHDWTKDEIVNFVEKYYHTNILILSNSVHIFPKLEKEKKYVFLTPVGNDSFQLVDTPAQIVSREKICPQCNKPVYSRHQCKKLCRSCKSPKENHPSSELNHNYCSNCNRKFYTRFCYDTHLETLCVKSYFCDCGSTVERGINHTCNIIRKCPRCSVEIDPFKNPCHICYIQCRTKTKKLPKYLIVYDIECCFRNEEHIPILLCAIIHKVTETDLVELQRKEFFGPSCLSDFTNYFLIGETYNNSIFIAHNSKAYDNCLILSHALKSQGVFPRNIILDGRKVSIMSYGSKSNKKLFLDFYQYFPFPLASFHKILNLSGGYKKQYFPYTFLTEDKINYIGKIPAKDYFDYEEKNTFEKETFDVWYDFKKIEIFDLKKILVDYCWQDCVVLGKAIQEYIKVFSHLASVHPFDEGVYTLPSLAFAIFRTNFMKKNSILNIPRNKIGKPTLASGIACAFFDFVNQNGYGGENFNLIHQGNSISGEIRVGKYYLDALDVNKRHIFEVMGCEWHGCPHCFDLESEPSSKKKSMITSGRTVEIPLQERYDATERRKRSLIGWGFKMTSIYVCQLPEKFMIYYKENIKSIRSRRKMDLAQAYVGGRTESFTMHMKKQEQLQIGYYDVQSLYPACLAQKEMPTDEFKIIRPNASDLEEITQSIRAGKLHGMICCDIIPRNDLFIPLLPIRVDKTIFFSLCRTCSEHHRELSIRAKEQHSRECPYFGKPLPTTPAGDSYFRSVQTCTHTEEERELRFCWTIVEVKKALELGYKLKRVHEIHAFEKTSKDLFRDFVYKFYKIKLAASAWPVGMESPQMQHRYINEINQKMGLDLKVEEMQPNPGKRTMAKLLLNASYGKMGETDHRKTTIITDKKQLNEMLTNPNIEILNYDNIADDVTMVHHKPKENQTLAHDNSIKPNYSRNNCLPIACHITSFARLEMYEYFERLEDQHLLVYTDTDSIITGFLCNEPETGILLGQLQAEVSEPWKIEEIYAFGPKQYMYKMKHAENGEEDIAKKFRGFRQTKDFHSKTTWEVAAKLYHGEQQNIGTKFNQFVRGKGFDIRTQARVKTYSIVNRKRIMVPSTNVTLPHGYNKACHLCGC